MKISDKKEFMAAWVAAWALYEKTPLPMTLNLAFSALEPWPLDEIKQALAAHVRDPDAGQFPPKPADVIRHIEGDAKAQNQVDEAQALVSWQEVLDAIRRVGQYEDCPITDPRALAAIEDLGGWTTVCLIETAALPHVRRQFVAAYRLLDAPRTPRARLGLASRGALGSGEARQIGDLIPEASR